ncbi:tyrosine-type recombinase/integrase [Candidatus Zixiibacteriota bacterium]
MRIFERPGKRRSTWYIDFTYKGRRHIRAVGPDRKMAELAAKKIETEIFEGKFFPDSKRSKVRLREFAVEYVEKYSKRRKRSWKRDLGTLKHLLPIFGDMCLADIMPKMIENYRISREQEGVMPATINREHALLKHMFTKAMDWGYVKENPAKRVRLAKEHPRIRFLTKDEIRSLLAAAGESKASHLKPILIMALDTAMRRGEIFNLRWEDVDFGRRAIQVKKTKNDQPREVPMTDRLYETLWDWKKKSLDKEYVFANTNGKSITTVRTAFTVALRKAGIKDFRFHDLRHTAASQMYMAGLDIKLIKEIGGWKTLAMVDRYSHLTTDHKRAAMLIYESHILSGHDTNLEQAHTAFT